jgi:adenine-specific DNA methylase
MHIRNKGNIEYDMIIVCKKREELTTDGYWEQIKDQIYLETKRELNNLQKNGRNLSQADIFVITMGKCLKSFSKFYPNVIKDNQKITVEEALDEIQEIVDSQLIGGIFDKLRDNIDLPTAIFLSYVAGRGGEISFSNLNKSLQQRGLNINSLLKTCVTKKMGSQIIIPEFSKIASEIESKTKEKLSAIEKAYYIIYFKKKDKIVEMRKWVNDMVIITLNKLSEIENKKEYRELSDHIRNQMKDELL